MIRTTTLALAISLFTSACTRSSDRPQPETTPTATPDAAQSPAASAPAPSPSGEPGESLAGAAAAAPAAEAAPAAPVAPAAPAAPAGPIPAPITGAVAIVGGATSPIAFDEPVTVDPAVRFQVDVAAPLVDARLALVDSGDAMISAVESHEIGATWSRFTLTPDAPLRPGSTYSLKLDGAAEREAHDADGRAYQITVWHIRTTGEAPPPEQPAARPKKKRR
ncbi:MAG TPA: hypothetical protein VFK85_02380 [Anaeromyxobacteraceae bacterium]|nr:hypothetical protein [Anaeromyxobacteraceae bacterium]